MALFDRTDRIIAHQTPVFFAARDGFGDPSRLPVFLVGPAGPTAKRLRAILCAHSRMVGAGPVGAINRITDALEAWDRAAGAARVYPECLDGLTAEDSMKAAGWVLDLIQKEEPGGEFILDGLAMDAALVGFAHLLFPNALLVASREEEGPSGPGEDAQRLWDAQNRLLDHWQQVLPNRLFMVEKRTLVGDPVGTSQAMFNRLGLPWEDRIRVAFKATPPPPSMTASRLGPDASGSETAQGGADAGSLFDPPPPSAQGRPGPMDQRADPIASALAHLRAGRVKAAEQILKAALTQKPNHPGALHLMGVVHYRLGHLQQAAVLMEQSVALIDGSREDWARNLQLVRDALKTQQKE